MEIYKYIEKDEYGIEEVYEYTTDNLIMDEPCLIKTIGNVYPIKVNEWSKFQKYIPYLINSKKHLKLKDTDNLLDSLIWLGAVSKNGGKPIDFNSESWIVYFNKSIRDFEDLFSMITKKRIRRFELGSSFVFTDDIGECMITEVNFEELRKVVQKMNLLSEPKIFEDKLMQKYYHKYLLAKNKNKKDINFGDIIMMVSHDMKISIKELECLNIFQLYSYYYRMNHVENYKSSILFKTVSDKVPNVDFSTAISEELYKENTDDMFISMDDISNKL